MIRKAISPRFAINIFENMVMAATPASPVFRPYGLTRKSVCPNSTVCPLLTIILVIVPLHSALMLLNTFMASMMQTSVSSSTCMPTVARGLASGLEAA